MRVLIFSDQPPLTTRASGDVRFSALISIICEFADVTFCNLPHWSLDSQPENKELISSIESLERAGCIIRDDFQDLIHQEQYDIVLFEFYDSALRYLDSVRFFQPNARIIIDSVDLHFRRFLVKAKLENTPEAMHYATDIKRQELSIYRSSDSVIMVTPEDVEALKFELPHMHTGLIPNIHNIPPLLDKNCGDPVNLIFVGGFRHAPNEDAVLYFAKDIWPKVKECIPSARMAVVGEQPSPAIKSLNRPDFQILGHVPELLPVLFQADISVAPLRWGGGIKGKVGEAMAFGLPVVTTSVGAEGFGLVPDKHAIVADQPEAFSAGIVRLVHDKQLFNTMRKSAHALVKERFSSEGMRHRVEAYLNDVLSRPAKKLSFSKNIRFTAKQAWCRHIAWRLS